MGGGGAREKQYNYCRVEGGGGVTLSHRKFRRASFVYNLSQDCTHLGVGQ